MANYPSYNDPKPKILDKYLGINQSVAETEIKFGEWAEGYNWRTTKEYKLEARSGWWDFIDFESEGNVQGVYYGRIASKDILLACWGGNVYEYDMSVSTDKVLVSELITEGTVTIVGPINDFKTEIFWFNDRILFKNKGQYKEYDGATLTDVVGTVPRVVLNSPPAGGGTLFQEKNLLTGRSDMTFVGDGVSTTYQLPEDNIDADAVTGDINGTPITEGVEFTVNRTLGQLLFLVAPISDAIVTVAWTKVDAGAADLILNNQFVTKFGYRQDNTLFMFGNVDNQNVYYFSYINDHAYFPANNFVPCDTEEFAVTDLRPFYQSLFVFKKNSAYVVQPSANPNFETNSGLNPYDFGYEGLNDHIGNLAPGMTQIISDTILTMDGKSIRQFVSSRGVRNEVEPEIISDRIKYSLQVLDLSKAVTFDYKYQEEFWMNIDDKVYIWNYGNDTMYIYDNIQSTEFIDVEDDIMFASNGAVRRYKEEYKADNMLNGTPIDCRVYGGFISFDVMELRKMMRRHWISIAPDAQTSIKIKFITDRVNEDAAKEITVGFKFFTFEDVNFDDLSFLTSENPQVIQFKYKVKKAAFIQWYFENNTNDEKPRVLELRMSVETNGFTG